MVHVKLIGGGVDYQLLEQLLTSNIVSIEHLADKSDHLGLEVGGARPTHDSLKYLFYNF